MNLITAKETKLEIKVHMVITRYTVFISNFMLYISYLCYSHITVCLFYVISTEFVPDNQFSKTKVVYCSF